MCDFYVCFVPPPSPVQTHYDLVFESRNIKLSGTKKSPAFAFANAGDFRMPVAGLEPARCCHQRILSPPRLPIPTHRHITVIIITHFISFCKANIKKICKTRKKQSHRSDKSVCFGVILLILRYPYRCVPQLWQNLASASS